MTDLTAAIEEAYASASAGGLVYWTVELDHPTFLSGTTPTPVRVVNDLQNLTAQLEPSAPIGGGTYVTFTALAFDVVPPTADDKSTGKGQLIIDVVDGTLYGLLLQTLVTTAPVTVILRAYAHSDLTQPGELYTGMILRNINVTATRATGDLSYEEIESKIFPRILYDRTTYPALLL